MAMFSLKNIEKRKKIELFSTRICAYLNTARVFRVFNFKQKAEDLIRVNKQAKGEAFKPIKTGYQPSINIPDPQWEIVPAGEGLQMAQLKSIVDQMHQTADWADREIEQTADQVKRAQEFLRDM